MSGEELNYNDLILEELQTQTLILQNIYDGYLEDKNLVDGFINIFPPLIFIYLIFGLFLKR